MKVSGGASEGVTPVPIPNTEVKPFSADDTARETVWERRSPPDLTRALGALPLEGPFSFPRRRVGDTRDNKDDKGACDLAGFLPLVLRVLLALLVLAVL